AAEMLAQIASAISMRSSTGKDRISATSSCLPMRSSLAPQRLGTRFVWRAHRSGLPARRAEKGSPTAPSEGAQALAENARFLDMFVVSGQRGAVALEPLVGFPAPESLGERFLQHLREVQVKPLRPLE